MKLEHRATGKYIRERPYVSWLRTHDTTVSWVQVKTRGQSTSLKLVNPGTHVGVKYDA